MPDDVKNALMARELKGKTDDETERLRRKYVRDMLDARAVEAGEVRPGQSSRDINLPADPVVVDRHVRARRDRMVWPVDEPYVTPEQDRRRRAQELARKREGGESR